MNRNDNVYELFVEIRDLLKSIKTYLAVIAESLGVAPIQPDNWVEVSTEQDVTINPGETKTVLEVRDSGWLWEVGVNDETYSTYMLVVDGTEIEEPQPQPWGLYNDPYRFPKPIEFGSSVEIRVERHSDAPGPAVYYAKVRYEKR